MAKVFYKARKVAAIAARIGLLPGYKLCEITKITPDLYLHFKTTEGNGAVVDYVGKCSPGAGGAGCSWTQVPYLGRPLVDASIAKCPPTVSPIDCDL